MAAFFNWQLDFFLAIFHFFKGFLDFKDRCPLLVEDLISHVNSSSSSSAGVFGELCRKMPQCCLFRELFVAPRHLSEVMAVMRPASLRPNRDEDEEGRRVAGRLEELGFQVGGY